jgi:small-conductance mechanosensitive channel
MNQVSGWLGWLGIPVGTVVSTIAIPVVAAFVIVAVTRALSRLLHGLRPRIHMHPNAVTVVTRTVGGLLWVCAGLLLVDAWGVSVGGLWTVLVSIVTAVGVGFLAVWTMVSNVTASLFIAIWRPFHFGETVEMLPEGLRGRVTDRNLMFTTIYESNGTVLHIPNNFFFQKIFRVGDDREFTTLNRAGDAVGLQTNQSGHSEACRETDPAAISTKREVNGRDQASPGTDQP